MLGAEARYGVGVAIPHHTGQWPVATLITNASGCLLIGVLMVAITELTRPHPLVRPLLGVGVLGGYTTFSTYSTDLVVLWHAGRSGAALAYFVATPIAALAAAWIGTFLTRKAASVLARRTGGPGHGRPGQR